jgi:hypothetical protein
MQRECNSRHHDGALMVDANGKKYESRVNNIAEKDKKADNKPKPQYLMHTAKRSNHMGSNGSNWVSFRPSEADTTALYLQ